MGNPKRASGKDLFVRGNNTRNALQYKVDEHWLVREVAKGRMYKDIAEDLNRQNGYTISAKEVGNMVQNVIVEWKRENMSNIDAVIGKELAKIELVEQKIWEDYEKSKGLRAVDYAALMKRGMSIEEIDKMFKGRMPGNPDYFEALLHCQMQKLRILGIDKGYDVPTNTVVNYNFGSLNDAQLAAMADRLQDAKAAELLREVAVDEQ